MTEFTHLQRSFFVFSHFSYSKWCERFVRCWCWRQFALHNADWPSQIHARVPTACVTPLIETLAESPTRTSSVGSTSRPEVWKLTGWMPETSAEDIAWTPFPSRPHKKTNSSSRESLAEMSDTSGPQAENATLLDVTDQVREYFLIFETFLTILEQICSHQMRTDGSGRAQESRLDQPLRETPETGATPEDTTKLSQTTVKLPKETTNLASQSSTTFTMTALNGLVAPSDAHSQTVWLIVLVPQHDVACYHLKPFVCEDSDELLNFVRSRNPGLKL